MFVSVVVPCFNAIETIKACLASLKEQDYPADLFEIVVADNGSTDGGPEWIAKHHPSVRIVHATQKGSGYARNAGIAEARGELICSTDSDCVVDRRWISSLVSAFHTAPANTGAIGGAILPFALNTSVERYRKAWVTQPALGDPETKVRYAATPNAAFRVGALRQVGGFDGTLGFDDTDLGLRLQAEGFSIGYQAEAIVRHRNPSTLKQLYRHRVKYGAFAYALALKHPEILGNPTRPAKRWTLLLETLRRIAIDVIRFPLSLVYRSEDGPKGWPVIDAVSAWGNYKGFVRASRR